MMGNKKFYVMILFIISCSIHITAQTGYYHKGKKIPLIVNDNKLCINITKENEKTCERILANIKVLNKIKDEKFKIFVISRSEYKKLTSLDFWSEDSKSIIVTSCYYTDTEGNEEVFATPYLNVRLKKEEDIDMLNFYVKQYKLTIVKNMPSMPLWYILQINPESEKSPLECANEIYESGDFAESIADFSFDAMTCSNDPLFNLQWGLHNSTHTDIDISVSSAWNYATGKSIKIAIIDTGVDLNHIDLASNISNLSYDTETNSSPSVLYDSHGTHCAGIAAAVKDNGIQIAGVAPEATIISISNELKLSTDMPLQLANGISWAYQYGADIISNSWRCLIHHPALEEAIQNAFRYGRNGKGCVVVFSTGNQSHDYINYPANCNDTILAVGAIDSTGVRYNDSNYGTGLDIVAPGVNILSTLPYDKTGYDSGTSMACPHVAGVAALILERNSELTVTQVNNIINCNAKKISGVNFNITKPNGSWNNEYGYGLVDAYNSVINTPSTVYIQNETITGTRNISAENIYVGRDVTNTKQYGDVTLGQGDITLKAKYVEIKNSTIVPLGTTLKIEN